MYKQRIWLSLALLFKLVDGSFDWGWFAETIDPNTLPNFERDCSSVEKRCPLEYSQNIWFIGGYFMLLARCPSCEDLKIASQVAIALDSSESEQKQIFRKIFAERWVSPVRFRRILNVFDLPEGFILESFEEATLKTEGSDVLDEEEDTPYQKFLKNMSEGFMDMETSLDTYIDLINTNIRGWDTKKSGARNFSALSNYAEYLNRNKDLFLKWRNSSTVFHTVSDQTQFLNLFIGFSLYDLNDPGDIFRYYQRYNGERLDMRVQNMPFHGLTTYNYDFNSVYFKYLFAMDKLYTAAEECDAGNLGDALEQCKDLLRPAHAAYLLNCIVDNEEIDYQLMVNTISMIGGSEAFKTVMKNDKETYRDGLLIFGPYITELYRQSYPPLVDDYTVSDPWVVRMLLKLIIQSPVNDSYILHLDIAKDLDSEIGIYVLAELYFSIGAYDRALRAATRFLGMPKNEGLSDGLSQCLSNLEQARTSIFQAGNVSAIRKHCQQLQKDKILVELMKAKQLYFNGKLEGSKDSVQEAYKAVLDLFSWTDTKKERAFIFVEEKDDEEEEKEEEPKGANSSVHESLRAQVRDFILITRQSKTFGTGATTYNPAEMINSLAAAQSRFYRHIELLMQGREIDQAGTDPVAKDDLVIRARNLKDNGANLVKILTEIYTLTTGKKVEESDLRADLRQFDSDYGAYRIFHGPWSIVELTEESYKQSSEDKDVWLDSISQNMQLVKNILAKHVETMKTFSRFTPEPVKPTASDEQGHEQEAGTGGEEEPEEGTGLSRLERSLRTFIASLKTVSNFLTKSPKLGTTVQPMEEMTGKIKSLCDSELLCVDGLRLQVAKLYKLAFLPEKEFDVNGHLVKRGLAIAIREAEQKLERDNGNLKRMGLRFLLQEDLKGKNWASNIVNGFSRICSGTGCLLGLINWTKEQYRSLTNEGNIDEIYEKMGLVKMIQENVALLDKAKKEAETARNELDQRLQYISEFFLTEKEISDESELLQQGTSFIPKRYTIWEQRLPTLCSGKGCINGMVQDILKFAKDFCSPPVIGNETEGYSRMAQDVFNGLKLTQGTMLSAFWGLIKTEASSMRKEMSKLEEDNAGLKPRAQLLEELEKYMLNGEELREETPKREIYLKSKLDLLCKGHTDCYDTLQHTVMDLATTIFMPLTESDRQGHQPITEETKTKFGLLGILTQLKDPTTRMQENLREYLKRDGLEGTVKKGEEALEAVRTQTKLLGEKLQAMRSEYEQRQNYLEQQQSKAEAERQRLLKSFEASKAETEEKVAVLTEEKRRLEMAIQKRKETLASFIKESEGETSRLRELETQLGSENEKAEERKAELIRARELLGEKLRLAKEVYQRQEAELLKATRELGQQVRELEQKQSELDLKLKEKESLVKKQEQAIESLNSEVLKVSSEFELLAKQHAASSTELRLRLQTKQKELEALQEKKGPLDEDARQLSSLSQQVAELESENKLQETRQREEREKLDKIKENLEAEKLQLGLLRKQLQQETSQHEKEQRSLSEEIARMKQALEKLQKEESAKRKQVELEKESIEELESQVGVAIEEAEKLKQSLSLESARLKEKLVLEQEESKRQNQTLSEVIRLQEMQLEQLIEERKEVELRVEEKKRMTLEQSDQLASLKREKQELETNIEVLQKQRGSTEEEWRKKLKEKEEELSTLRLQENELSANAKKYLELEREVTNLKMQNEIEEGRQEQAKSQLKRSKKELKLKHEEHNSLIKGLEQELSEKQLQLEEIQRQIESTKAVIQERRDEHLKTKEALELQQKKLEELEAQQLADESRLEEERIALSEKVAEKERSFKQSLSEAKLAHELQVKEYAARWKRDKERIAAEEAKLRKVFEERQGEAVQSIQRLESTLLALQKEVDEAEQRVFSQSEALREKVAHEKDVLERLKLLEMSGDKQVKTMREELANKERMLEGLYARIASRSLKIVQRSLQLEKLHTKLAALSAEAKIAGFSSGTPQLELIINEQAKELGIKDAEKTIENVVVAMNGHLHRTKLQSELLKDRANHLRLQTLANLHDSIVSLKDLMNYGRFCNQTTQLEAVRKQVQARPGEDVVKKLSHKMGELAELRESTATEGQVQEVKIMEEMIGTEHTLEELQHHFIILQEAGNGSNLIEIMRNLELSQKPGGEPVSILFDVRTSEKAPAQKEEAMSSPGMQKESASNIALAQLLDRTLKSLKSAMKQKEESKEYGVINFQLAQRLSSTLAALGSLENENVNLREQLAALRSATEEGALRALNQQLQRMMEENKAMLRKALLFENQYVDLSEDLRDTLGIENLNDARLEFFSVSETVRRFPTDIKRDMPLSRRLQVILTEFNRLYKQCPAVVPKTLVKTYRPTMQLSLPVMKPGRSLQAAARAKKKEQLSCNERIEIWRKNLRERGEEAPHECMDAISPDYISKMKIEELAWLPANLLSPRQVQAIPPDRLQHLWWSKLTGTEHELCETLRGFSQTRLASLASNVTSCSAIRRSCHVDQLVCK